MVNLDGGFALTESEFLAFLLHHKKVKQLGWVSFNMLLKTIQFQHPQFSTGSRIIFLFVQDVVKPK